MDDNKELVVQETAYDENENVKHGFKDYLYGVWYNFIDSFRYNPCKLAGILVALPGLFIGFFLGFHSNITFLVKEGQTDYSGLLMFILVLMGCINIANGVTLSSKRNLGSVIVSSLCSLIITICGVLWIYLIFYSYHLVNSGQITLESEYSMGFNTIMSLLSVALSIVCSIAGCILGYFKRNKDYKKVKF